jgi:hypothetical protein
MVGVGLKCGLMDRVYLKEGRENREAGPVEGKERGTGGSWQNCNHLPLE